MPNGTDTLRNLTYASRHRIEDLHHGIQYIHKKNAVQDDEKKQKEIEIKRQVGF